MDLIGIDNEAEFFPSGTLSDVLKEELQDITARWAGLDRTAHPVERLARVAGPTIEALRQVRSEAGEASAGEPPGYRRCAQPLAPRRKPHAARRPPVRSLALHALQYFLPCNIFLLFYATFP